jgi:Lrp/AsnC family transcriptional regulator for asnA, asnC and gidA
LIVFRIEPIISLNTQSFGKENTAMEQTDIDLDSMDIKILSFLQEDGRMPYRKIADKLNTTVMTITRRVREMKKAGVIRRFTVVIDPESVGKRYSICLFVQVDNPSAINEVSSILSENKDLCYVHHVTGEFEIAAMARCRDKEEASRLIEKVGTIKGVLKVIPHSVLRTIKENLDIHLTQLSKADT